MTLKLQKWPKNNNKKKQTQNDEKIHYKITTFGACAPHPRLIYWIASSKSEGKKDDMSSKSGSWWWHCLGTVCYLVANTDNTSGNTLSSHKINDYNVVIIVTGTNCNSQPQKSAWVYSSCFKLV